MRPGHRKSGMHKSAHREFVFDDIPKWELFDVVYRAMLAGQSDSQSVAARLQG